jgi:hypothetical protein
VIDRFGIGAGENTTSDPRKTKALPSRERHKALSCETMPIASQSLTAITKSVKQTKSTIDVTSTSWRFCYQLTNHEMGISVMQ